MYSYKQFQFVIEFDDKNNNIIFPRWKESKLLTIFLVKKVLQHG
jgi:hypothetical protein